MATLSFGDAYQLALDAGASEDEARLLAAIAGAESSYNTEIHGDINLQDGTWGPSVGLWQIRSVKAQTGTGDVRDIDKLTDPVENARSAISILRSQGWKAWSTFTNGAYKKFLNGDISKVPGVGQVAQAQGVGATPAKVPGLGQILGHIPGMVTGKSPAEQDALMGLASQHGDSLGERLQSILHIINGGQSG